MNASSRLKILASRRAREADEPKNRAGLRRVKPPIEAWLIGAVLAIAAFNALRVLIN